MSTAVLPPVVPVSYHGRAMTLDEFLNLPEDGIERDLINGIVKERGDVSYRSRRHTRTMTRVSHLLETWAEKISPPPGTVYTGDVGVRLQENPVIAVGLDVAFFPADVVAHQPRDPRVFMGIPSLAVEIFSPSDRHDSVGDRIEQFMEFGFPHFWLVDNRLKTITVYQPGAPPRLFSGGDVVTAEPHLPGLAVRVSDCFTGVE